MAQHGIDQQQLEAETEQDERQDGAMKNGQPERRPGMHGAEHQEGRQHDELALREIDRLRGLPEQREADGDQRNRLPRREAAISRSSR